MPNLALTQVLSGAGADGVANLQSGRYEVPFGVVDVIVNEANLRFVGRDRGSAMHQHHRDAPVAVRLQRNEVVVGCAGGSGQRVIERPGQFPGPALPSTAVAGFFKQYELAIIAADDRDVVRVRSNIRGEDVRIYRLRMTPANARVLLREYVEAANELARAPRFYNTLTSNCTTLVFGMVRVIHPGVPMDARVLFSGYLPTTPTI